jgi:type I restriction enzyme S subunit
VSLPRYPEYKDSGVEWLGQVPKHWNTIALKHLANLQSGSSITAESIADEGPYPVYGGNGRRGFTSDFTHDGAFVLVGRQGALCGNVNFASGKFWASEHAVVCAPRRELALRWFGEVLRAMNLGQYSVAAAQPGLSVEIILRLVLPVPPLSEQRAISQLLERETAKIDALVAEQQRLIELLQEKRQAVISHAVTKGLNPDAPMKDSGIEWLGQIPAHWEVRPLKSSARLVGRIGYRGYTTADIVGEGEGALALSPSNIVNGEMSFARTTFISWDKYNESPEIMIAQDDVLLVKTGSTFGRPGFVGSLPGPATLNPQLAVFKDLRCVPRFLYFGLTTPRLQSLFQVSNKGSTIPTLSQEDVGNFDVAWPPMEEQAAIVRSVVAALSELAELVDAANAAVALLNERRAALISAAVTGQIDVRAAAGRSA